MSKEEMFERIENNFTTHELSESKVEDTYLVRSYCWELANHLIHICPESRELTVAIRKLEEVMFYANAAIARYDD